MLDRIPPEILDRIILLCDPIDVASLAQLSKFVHGRICYNNTLWLRIFLSYFDDPCGAEAVIRSAFESHPSTVRVGHQPTQIDWRATLIARIILRQILGTTETPLFIRRLGKHYPLDRLESLYQLIFLILYTAQTPQHSASAYPNPIYAKPPALAQSHNLTFLHGLLSNPTTQLHLFELPAIQTGRSSPVPRLYADITGHPNQGAAAKLHTMFGLTRFDLECTKTRGLVRERCYAAANYTAQNLYGPFIPSQSTRTNWSHLRDLFLVVALNLNEIRRSQQEEEESPQQRPHSNPLPNLPVNPPPFTLPNPLTRPNFPPPPPTPPPKTEKFDWPILSGLQSVVPFTQTSLPACSTLERPPPANLNGDVDLNLYDWAGVAGKWWRVVCFLNYEQYFAYNFRPESSKSLDHTTEIVRSMTLDLEVVSIRDPPDDSHPTPLDLRTDLPHRPPIFFKGKLTYNVGVSNLPIAETTLTLRGCVSMTIDDEVRWSMVSTMSGADKWASEGIQVGGVRSKWGVLGTWTDCNRDREEEPVGPFYFFKTC